MTYWIGVVIFSAVMLATGGAGAARDRLRCNGPPTAVVAIFFLVFAYQLGTYFYRNRPGRYRPDAIPPSVLPKI